jgi:uncharacterized protein YjbI with pentapeptide repeats
MLEPGEVYEQVVFDDTAFNSSAAGNCHFLECTFDHGSFGEKRMRKCRFTDSRLREVRFVTTDLAETAWLDTELTGCALSGVQAFSAQLRRITFRDCKLDSVNFREGTFTEVTFENCLLRDVDFGGAKLTSVRFPGCKLGADFTKATCAKVDLRGAALAITAGYDALRGTTIDTVQLVSLAPLLAQQLGIAVED